MPENKEYRFASRQEFLDFLDNARLSPTLCEKVLAPFRRLPNLSASISTLPNSAKSALWEGGPEVEYVDAVMSIQARKIGKSGARVLYLRTLPLMSVLTADDEPGVYPAEINCGAMNANDGVKGWCGFLRMAATAEDIK